MAMEFGASRRLSRNRNRQYRRPCAATKFTAFLTNIGRAIVGVQGKEI
jgi:hypothetical protein